MIQAGTRTALLTPADLRLKRCVAVYAGRAKASIERQISPIINGQQSNRMEIHIDRYGNHCNNHMIWVCRTRERNMRSRLCAIIGNLARANGELVTDTALFTDKVWVIGHARWRTFYS